MSLFDALVTAIQQITEGLTEAHKQIEWLRSAKDNSVIDGRVTDRDPKKARVRIAIGVDADGKDVKSPWIPYSQIAGTRKVHSVPSIGQQLRVIAPNGDLSQAWTVPLTWWDDNPAPSEDGDEDIDLRGKTRRTQRDGSLKQEIDGVTEHHTKQSHVLTIHKDPETQSEGKDEEVSDKKPWKGNRGKTKHKRALNKDAGYTLTINDGDDQNEHKVIVHPDGKIEHSIKKGKHKVTIDGDKIEASWDNGKHKTSLKPAGITHSVDNGQHEVQINSASGGLAGMLGGQLPGLLGGANMGALTNQLRSLLGSGALGGVLGGAGGGLGGLLNGQLGQLLTQQLLTQLGSELSSALGSGSLGGMLQPGIVHKSSSTVQIESPQIEHMGDLKVMGSVKALQVIQSAIGLKAPIVGASPGAPPDAKDW